MLRLSLLNRKLKVWRSGILTAALHFDPSLTANMRRLVHGSFTQKSISVCVSVRVCCCAAPPWAMMSVSFSARSSDSQLLMRSRPPLPFLRAAHGILRCHFSSFLPLTFRSEAAGRRHSRNVSSEPRRRLGASFIFCSRLVRGK